MTTPTEARQAYEDAVLARSRAQLAATVAHRVAREAGVQFTDLRLAENAAMHRHIAELAAAEEAYQADDGDVDPLLAVHDALASSPEALAAVRLTHDEKETLRPVIRRYARWETAHDAPVFEAIEQVLANRSGAVCPTCGPTPTELHPRITGVVRCSNCKEHLT